jgi:LPXTG-site transpeptidase (sortase) family protein
VTVTDRRQAARSELASLCAELNVLALELTVPPPRARRRWLPQASALLTVLGVLLIVGGLALAGRPLLAMLERGNADQTALAQWRQSGSHALVGSAPVAAAAPAVPRTGACGGASAADAYALVTFPSLAAYGYSGVAGDGSWDLLLRRSMVHFHGSAAPGATGNDIIAFHREPDFEHVDRLAVGDTVVVQDRGCRLWHYTVRHRWLLAPERVTQLGTTTRAVLTLITCDPWFRDVNRIVWQADLTDAQPSRGS